MDRSPLFSVITVCFNSEKTIERTMKSVADQTCDDYEYIIIDGGSKDSTNDVITMNLPLIRNQTNYISEPDDGIYDAMNKGIRMAMGKFICFLNSDDWFEKNALEKVKQTYSRLNEKEERNPYMVIYGGQRTITNGLEENCVFYNHQFLMQNMVCHQACFTSRECFEKFGLFNGNYRSAADYDFTLKLYLSNTVDFFPLHETLVNFSSGGMNESYIGRAESNEIRYKLGVISRKAYYIEKLKIKASQFTYFMLRKKPQKVSI